MRSPQLHFLSVLVCTLLALNPACIHSQAPETASFVLLRTVELPVEVLEADVLPGTSQEHPERLAIAVGAEDELPQGPQGFEVLPDGGFVLADPLRRRLAFYDSLGTYFAEWAIGFPASSISLLDDGTLEVRNVHTGGYYIVTDGQPRPMSPEVRRARVASEYGEATLDRSTRNRGQITLAGIRGQSAGTLEVTLDSDTTQMISLQSLGTTPEDNVYVALETTGGGDVVKVEKIIRAYDSDGQLLGQIVDIPLDYFIHPVNEFQIEGNKVYQLMPRQDAVYINVWVLQ